MQADQPTDRTIYDVCIIGAGVAGATMAAYLGNHGKKVAVVERRLSERDVIVGELLQPGGVELLQDLGLGHFLENIDAQPVYGYNVILNERNYLIPYPSENDRPVCGYGFRNGKFVQNMRQYIISLENVDVFEGKVTSFIEDEGSYNGVFYLPKDSGREDFITAKLTIVSDGPLSSFRTELSKPEVKLNGYFLGVILQDCELPYPNHGHLMMGNYPPLVIYPVNSEEIRILIDFPGDKPPKMGPELKDQLLDQFYNVMPSSMKPSFQQAAQRGRFKIMPNHRLPARPVLKKGAVLLGDSLNMRHPLTGGGMTAAFADIKNLGGKLICIDDFNNNHHLQEAVKDFYKTRHLGNQTINILADALYGVVKHPGLREAFFGYISQGGKYAEEPVAILAGINKDKMLLLKHFIAVARYGSTHISGEHGINRIGKGYNLLKDAAKIITPLLMTEKPDKATEILLKSFTR